MKKQVKSSKIRSINNIKENSAKVNKKAVSKESSVSAKNRVRSAKIRMTKVDKELEQSDNISIAAMIFIIVICFVVGIGLGYILYNLAISNSSASFIVNNGILKL